MDDHEGVQREKQQKEHHKDQERGAENDDDDDEDILDHSQIKLCLQKIHEKENELHELRKVSVHCFDGNNLIGLFYFTENVFIILLLFTQFFWRGKKLN